MLKIAVCDDVTSERQKLISLIKSEASCAEVYEYRNGETLLRDYANAHHFNIIFLDIFMDGMSGLEAAGLIRKFDSNVIIIFVSSSDDFYRQSYELYAFNYLIKPLTKDKISDVLHRAEERINKELEQVLYISYMGATNTLRCSQLLYLSSEQHNVNFHLINGKVLKAYGKLEDFHTRLPSEAFVRCHQSFIVNLDHVTNMTSTTFMVGETKISISRKYSKEARTQYRALIFNNF